MSYEKWFRDQVAQSRVEVGVRYEPALFPGLEIAICIGPRYRGPLGQVWYEWTARGEIDIVYSFVDPRAQRMGVRTRIHEALRAAYPDYPMVTAGNSGPAAEAWQRKMGWEPVGETPGPWVLEVG